MKRHSVSLLIILVATEAARYGDYSGARMPHYGIEYDNKDPAPLTDEYSDHSPDAAVSFDYKYEEEPRDKIDTQEPDSWHKTSKKRKTPLKAIEMDENEQEIIPKLKSNFRIQQHRTRNKDLHKKSGKRRYYSDINRNGDVDHVHDRNEYKLNKDRSREEDKIYLDNFDLRDTTRKLARRKPRDRTIRQEKLDEMGDDLLGFKEKESDDDTTVIVYEKERRMQTTEKIPRISIPGIKGKQTNNQEYDEYYDMKRVHNLKNKLPLLFRQTKEVVTVTSVAERELRALLGHRQRKEVSSPAGALPTTFPPNAVDPAFEDEWKTFIQNKSMSLKQTTIVSVILIINYLYGYG